MKQVATNGSNNPIDLIVDRSESLSKKETDVFGKEAERIRQDYRNIWPLDDSKPCFAARGFI